MSLAQLLGREVRRGLGDEVELVLNFGIQGFGLGVAVRFIEEKEKERSADARSTEERRA
jgi:hypothetical protein